jgi:hypothetical protein
MGALDPGSRASSSGVAAMFLTIVVRDFWVNCLAKLRLNYVAVVPGSSKP